MKTETGNYGLENAVEVGESVIIDLDARAYACPLPLLKLKQALQTMDEGQLIRVRTSDPVSKRDFASYCDLSAHRLVNVQERDSEIEFMIQKG